MQNKKMFITYLNVFASLSVVFLHNNGIVHLHPIGKTWVSAIFIETLFYSAVPLFFMISGCTLIDYKEKYTTKEFFRKRIKKTLIPFIFWSIFGMVYLCYKNHNLSLFSEHLINIVSNILNSRYIAIYWFFVPLFSAYMCIPILANINDKIKTFKYLIIVGFIFMGIIPFIFNLLSGYYNYNIVPCIVNGYIFYSIVGYYLMNTYFEKKNSLIIYMLGFIGFLSNFIGTAVMTPTGGEIASLFRGAFNWPCFLQTIAIFELFKNIQIKNDRINCILNWMSEKTFGVYLIHIYFVWEMPYWFGISTYNLLWRIFGSFLIFILCCLVVNVLQKIPLIKRIVP